MYSGSGQRPVNHNHRRALVFFWVGALGDVGEGGWEWGGHCPYACVCVSVYMHEHIVKLYTWLHILATHAYHHSLHKPIIPCTYPSLTHLILAHEYTSSMHLSFRHSPPTRCYCLKHNPPPRCYCNTSGPALVVIEGWGAYRTCIHLTTFVCVIVCVCWCVLVGGWGCVCGYVYRNAVVYRDALHTYHSCACKTHRNTASTHTASTRTASAL